MVKVVLWLILLVGTILLSASNASQAQNVFLVDMVNTFPNLTDPTAISSGIAWNIDPEMLEKVCKVGSPVWFGLICDFTSNSIIQLFVNGITNRWVQLANYNFQIMISTDQPH